MKAAIRSAVSAARRSGYRIDHEVYSEAGIAVLRALTEWRQERGMSFESYVAMLTCQALWEMVHNQREFTLLPQDLFIDRKKWFSRHDDAQRLLLTLIEPWRSICFDVWINGAQYKATSQKYGVPIGKMRLTMDRIAVRMIAALENMDDCITE